MNDLIKCDDCKGYYEADKSFYKCSRTCDECYEDWIRECDEDNR